MKRLILFLSLLAAVLIGIMFVRRDRSPERLRSESASGGSLGHTERPEENLTRTGSVITNQSSWWTNRYARKKNTSNATIDFWGKVVDEKGVPLSGVKVQISLRKWPLIRAALFNEASFTSLEVATDQNGLFELKDESGDSLKIVGFQKDGFTNSNNQLRSYAFGLPQDHLPSPDRPVIFKMYKKRTGPSPRLTPYEVTTRIPCDGQPVMFDVIEGRRIETLDAIGDIRVTLQRTPVAINRGSTDYDWTARVEVLGGGLVLSKESINSVWGADLAEMYEAPESGYAPFYEIEMRRSDPNWVPSKAVAFFFRSRNGKYYGRAVLQFDPLSDQNTVPFTLISHVNPRSSREL